MFSRVFLIFSCLFVLAGCMYNDEPMPRITQDYTINSSAQQGRTWKAIDESIPADWLPPSGVEKNWTAIVIHHSGTKSGSAAIFDKWHRQGNH